MSFSVEKKTHTKIAQKNERRILKAQSSVESCTYHRTMQCTTQACWLIWIIKIFLAFRKTIYPFPFLWQGLNWWKSGRKTLGWLLRGGSCRDMLSKTEISVKKICDWSKNYVLSWLSNESTCWMNARGDWNSCTWLPTRFPWVSFKTNQYHENRTRSTQGTFHRSGQSLISRARETRVA